MKVLDMVGKKFGSLTVVRRGSNSVGGQAQWFVKCDCVEPMEFLVLGNNLRRGNTTGCPHIKRNRGRKSMIQIRRRINAEIELDMVGKKVGDLTVLARFDTTPQGATRWVCSCSCGRVNTVLARTAALKSGSAKGCKFCKSDSMKLASGVAMKNHLKQIYKAAAKRRNYVWALSDEQFDSITQLNCHYCGEPPSERIHNLRFNGAYTCNGIDRMDNTKGYIRGNVVPACTPCNHAKGTMSYNEYRAFLIKAGKFQLQLSTVE